MCPIYRGIFEFAHSVGKFSRKILFIVFDIEGIVERTPCVLFRNRLALQFYNILDRVTSFTADNDGIEGAGMSTELNVT